MNDMNLLRKWARYPCFRYTFTFSFCNTIKGGSSPPPPPPPLVSASIQKQTKTHSL